MAGPLEITISPAFSRPLGDGATLVGYANADDVSLLLFPKDAQRAQQTWDLSYDDYEKFRQQTPSLGLPELKPRKAGTQANGNTIGSVVGETPSTAGKATQANPGVAPETPKEEGWWGGWGSAVVHTVLDVGGAIPVIGIVSDGLNAGIYAAEGDMVNAAFSGASAAANLIPGGGAVMKGGKLAVKGGELLLKGGERMALRQAEKELAERALKEKLEKEIAERTARAEKEAAEAEARGAKKSDTQVKKKTKPKPKCGQQAPYKDRGLHDNTGFNWDHVPSQAALLKAARDVKGGTLTSAEIKAITEAAPTIAIPGELHQKHSETYGGRQHQSVDGMKRPTRDAQDLQRAAKENTDKILEAIDDYDPGCKGEYRKAAQKITAMTHDEWKKWLKKIMKSANQ